MYYDIEKDIAKVLDYGVKLFELARLMNVRGKDISAWRRQDKRRLAGEKYKKRITEILEDLELRGFKKTRFFKGQKV